MFLVAGCSTSKVTVDEPTQYVSKLTGEYWSLSLSPDGNYKLFARNSDNVFYHEGVYRLRKNVILLNAKTVKARLDTVCVRVRPSSKPELNIHLFTDYYTCNHQENASAVFSYSMFSYNSCGNHIDSTGKIRLTIPHKWFPKIDLRYPFLDSTKAGINSTSGGLATRFANIFDERKESLILQKGFQFMVLPILPNVQIDYFVYWDPAIKYLSKGKFRLKVLAQQERNMYFIQDKHTIKKVLAKPLKPLQICPD